MQKLLMLYKSFKAEHYMHLCQLILKSKTVTTVVIIVVKCSHGWLDDGGGRLGQQLQF